MELPHELAFRYRPQLFMVVLLVGAAISLFALARPEIDSLAMLVFLAVVTAVSYFAMRLFVAIAVKPLAASHPRIVRGWGLIWFYGALPLSLTALFIGAHELNVLSAGWGLIGLLVVVATSMSAAAFESIRVTAHRLTIGSSDRGAATSVTQGEGR
jgi:hypothetical protein